MKKLCSNCKFSGIGGPAILVDRSENKFTDESNDEFTDETSIFTLNFILKITEQLNFNHD